jgi:SSS family solute:Na+ symporter
MIIIVFEIFYICDSSIIAISVVIAIVQYKSNVTFIAQLMGISWGALAGAFLAPFLLGLYWKRVTKASVWVSFIFSAMVMILNIVVNPVFPKLLQSPINAGVFCMLAGFVIVPVVSLLTKAPNKEYVENVFSCYDKKVIVSAADAIGEPMSKEEVK